jgi:hypothetical protein
MATAAFERDAPTMADMGYAAADLDALVKSAGDAVLKRAGDDASTAPKFGGDLAYRVVVDCAGEAEQAEMLERFESEGLTCRPLIS